MLAARYRKPLPIIAGILAATIANHALAALLGTWLTELLGPRTLRWIVALSFIAMGAWILVPDKLDEVKGDRGLRFGVFGATAIAFFLAEMGDKTQVATVALAARFHAYVAVVAGTTLGMLAANVPVVLFGGRMAGKFSAAAVHRTAAALFVLLGVLTLLY